jgi:hypothetical protein
MKQLFNRKNLKLFLITGLIYAIGMAGFDYIDGKSFSYIRFLINFLFFGLLFTAGIHFTSKKSDSKN